MLKVEGLRCNYGTASILEDVSIEVRDGEVLALLGRNGMGKTTLVRALAGIDPPQVVAGSVSYQGEELLELEIGLLGKRSHGACQVDLLRIEVDIDMTGGKDLPILIGVDDFVGAIGILGIGRRRRQNQNENQKR